jgi:pantetheine-phosphate adenylyltransferase
MTLAIYPGSFDPITLGHLDVIGRASAVFERLAVAVLINPRKVPLLDEEVRVRVTREAVDEAFGERAAGIEIVTFDGLTVDLARRLGARFIVRGLRGIGDFDSELQMANTNRKLAPEVDTVFFMTAIEHAYVSSSLVREVAGFGGDVRGMVPAAAVRALQGVTGR